MRYHPNTLKSCFLIYPIKNRITITETINAVTIPVTRTMISFPVIAASNFNTLRRLAPSITGIARKKVNSAATVLDTPIKSAPKIVAPEREVPGKMAAINWKNPIISAVLKVISDQDLILALLCLFLFSIIRKPTPNTINAIATQTPL